MGLTIVSEVIAANSTQATYKGADDLLAKFGLSRLYTAATTCPPSNPYQKLKQAGDRRLFKAERWAIATVVDWPEGRNYQWKDYSQAELQRAFPLGPGAFDLQDAERGTLVAGVTVGPANLTPSASEGPSDAVSGGRLKIKIKTGGAKRSRAVSQEPSAITSGPDVGGSQSSLQAPSKASAGAG